MAASGKPSVMPLFGRDLQFVDIGWPQNNARFDLFGHALPSAEGDIVRQLQGFAAGDAINSAALLVWLFREQVESKIIAELKQRAVEADALDDQTLARKRADLQARLLENSASRWRRSSAPRPRVRRSRCAVTPTFAHCCGLIELVCRLAGCSRVPTPKASAGFGRTIEQDEAGARDANLKVEGVEVAGRVPYAGVPGFTACAHKRVALTRVIQLAVLSCAERFQHHNINCSPRARSHYGI